MQYIISNTLHCVPVLEQKHFGKYICLIWSSWKSDEIDSGCPGWQNQRYLSGNHVSSWSPRQTHPTRSHLRKKGPNFKDSCARSCQRCWNVVFLLGQPEGSSQKESPDSFHLRRSLTSETLHGCVEDVWKYTLHIKDRMLNACSGISICKYLYTRIPVYSFIRWWRLVLFPPLSILYNALNIGVQICLSLCFQFVCIYT